MDFPKEIQKAAAPVCTAVEERYFKTKKIPTPEEVHAWMTENGQTKFSVETIRRTMGILYLFIRAQQAGPIGVAQMRNRFPKAGSSFTSAAARIFARQPPRAKDIKQFFGMETEDSRQKKAAVEKDLHKEFEEYIKKAKGKPDMILSWGQSAASRIREALAGKGSIASTERYKKNEERAEAERVLKQWTKLVEERRKKAQTPYRTYKTRGRRR